MNAASDVVNCLGVAAVLEAHPGVLWDEALEDPLGLARNDHRETL